MAASLTDAQVSRLAKARVGLRFHAFLYLAINLFMLGIWFLAGRGYYWPAWTHLGWGIGLAFHGFGAYGPGADMVAREEEKLRRQHGGT